MPFVLCLKIQMVNDKRGTCVQFSVGGTKMKRIGYKHTVAASFTAFVVQAVVNNFMTILPEILPSAFAGLLISVFCYAVGAGLLDITINPIVNSCPSTNSNQLLCLLHSFYCWGSVAAVGISTLFFALFSTDNWKIMSLIWAILPIVNAVMFTRVPIAPVVGEDEEKLSIKDMLKTKAFWIFMVLILCAGSSEQAVSQWASTFAEKALGLTKTVGDLAGPMLFSILMGVSRFMYGKFGNRINLDSMMLLSGCVCTASYFLISLTSSPILGLVGVAVCGLSAGILWPGTIGKMSSALHGGGTAMYAILCLGGDIGCSAGPTFAGMMASAFGDDLKKGILCAVIFPLTLSVIMLVREFIIPRRRKKAAS